jgi:two-component system, sporulation sensor kinase E
MMPRCRWSRASSSSPIPSRARAALHGALPQRRRGGARRFAVILSDITREKQTTEARIEDERTSSILLLAAGVAHELGNPLNSLTIHLQLIERKLRKLKAGLERDRLAHRFDQVCQEEVTRLDGIITNFLDAIRPRPPDLAEVNLADVISEVLPSSSASWRTATSTWRRRPPRPAAGDGRPQPGEAGVLQHREERGRGDAAGGRLRIRVADGRRHVGACVRRQREPASSRRILLRLFQPYHTTKPGGHGLGLMIVQRIMRDHGGQIGIESKEGVGTIVTLQFPRKHRRVRMLPGT